MPFLIAWGDTEHPATIAPHGLALESFEIEHPEPDWLAAALGALGTDIDVKPATAFALVAHIRGPNGMKELR